MSREPGGGSRPRLAFNTLRSLARESADANAEHCGVCSEALPEEHPHLFDPTTRQIMCVCAGCAVSVGDQQGSRYRRIPHHLRLLAGFQMPDQLWDSLLIPVGMAFFFLSTPAGKVMAMYPSPAGATESLLDLATWAAVVQENPILKEMSPDVEALLINRVRGAREYYIVPIDRCFELVGLIRVHWRGLAGGAEVWDQIDAFFSRLKKRSLGGKQLA